MTPPALLAFALAPLLVLTPGCTTKTKAPTEKAPALASTRTPTPAPVPAPVSAVDIAVVDIKPRAYRQPAATFPSALRQSGVSGKVILGFILDTEGRPTQIRLLEASHELFTTPAIEALSRWRFYPAQKDGLPVACSMQQSFAFAAAKHP